MHLRQVHIQDLPLIQPILTSRSMARKRTQKKVPPKINFIRKIIEEQPVVSINDLQIGDNGSKNRISGIVVENEQTRDQSNQNINESVQNNENESEQNVIETSQHEVGMIGIENEVQIEHLEIEIDKSEVERNITCQPQIGKVQCDVENVLKDHIGAEKREFNSETVTANKDDANSSKILQSAEKPMFLKVRRLSGDKLSISENVANTILTLSRETDVPKINKLTSMDIGN